MMHKKARKVTVLFLTILMLSLGGAGLSEQPETTPAPAASLEASMPPETTLYAPTQPSGGETTPATMMQTESISSPEQIQPEEAPPSLVPVEEEDTETPSPTVDVEQTAENEHKKDVGPVDDEALVAPSPTLEAIEVTITLRWDISSEDGLLRVGDQAMLAAELTSGGTGLALQWQAAPRSASEPTQDETEWRNIAGAHGIRYTFIVQEDMQPWRWRLCVTTPDGGNSYSEEMRLPKLTAVEEESALLDDSEPLLGVAGTPPPPVDIIIHTANTPLDEIAYGDEMTLVADIQNTHEGMLLQWQHMPAGIENIEAAWQSVEGANKSAYTYVVTEENISWIWRLLITVPQETRVMDDEGSMEEAEPLVEGDTILELIPIPTADIIEVPVEELPPEAGTIETIGTVEE